MLNTETLDLLNSTILNCAKSHIDDYDHFVYDYVHNHTSTHDHMKHTIVMFRSLIRSLHLTPTIKKMIAHAEYNVCPFQNFRFIRCLAYDSFIDYNKPVLNVDLMPIYTRIANDVVNTLIADNFNP